MKNQNISSQFFDSRKKIKNVPALIISILSSIIVTVFFLSPLVVFIMGSFIEAIGLPESAYFLLLAVTLLGIIYVVACSLYKIIDRMMTKK